MKYGRTGPDGSFSRRRFEHGVARVGGFSGSTPRRAVPVEPRVAARCDDDRRDHRLLCRDRRAPLSVRAGVGSSRSRRDRRS